MWPPPPFPHRHVDLLEGSHPVSDPPANTPGGSAASCLGKGEKKTTIAPPLHFCSSKFSIHGWAPRRLHEKQGKPPAETWHPDPGRLQQSDTSTWRGRGGRRRKRRRKGLTRKINTEAASSQHLGKTFKKKKKQGSENTRNVILPPIHSTAAHNPGSAHALLLRDNPNTSGSPATLPLRAVRGSASPPRVCVCLQSRCPKTKHQYPNIGRTAQQES